MRYGPVQYHNARGAAYLCVQYPVSTAVLHSTRGSTTDRDWHACWHAGTTGSRRAAAGDVRSLEPPSICNTQRLFPATSLGTAAAGTTTMSCQVPPWSLSHPATACNQRKSPCL